MNLGLAIELRLNNLELAIELQAFLAVDISGKIGLAIELRLNNLELAIELQAFLAVDKSGKIGLSKSERLKTYLEYDNDDSGNN
jgi:hypothetical protein